MEFITGKCPKCSGELQIPENRDSIICMYCGEEIDTKQAIEGVKEQVEVTPEKKAQHNEYVRLAMEGFPKMLFAIEDPLKHFKKKEYEGSFREYQELHKTTMDAIEDAYLTCDNREELLAALAQEFVAKVNESMSQKKKRQQEDTLMNYNMCIVVYINPALIDYNKSSGKLLAEELLCQWKNNFPKTNLKISDFETINSGFKRRFCYITTAVCESLGKPDDCYELNTLRAYRDNYLDKTEEGEEMIRRYYDIAPTIVKHINQNQEREAIYASIWKQYLSPCIQLIEQNENEECRVLYQNMVDTLAKQYFN